MANMPIRAAKPIHGVLAIGSSSTKGAGLVEAFVEPVDLYRDPIAEVVGVMLPEAG
jgi:hypothetical protein